VGTRAFKIVHIPYIEPLSEMERKSPRLLEQLKYCEDGLAEGEKFNDGIPTIPSILKPLTMLFEQLNLEQKNHQRFVDHAYNSFVEIRKGFHDTLKRHSDCYHQVLAYDQIIAANPNFSNCKKQLDNLWDMFTYGDVYFKNEFMSYFWKYKIELDEAMAQVKT
jgi:RNAse (barnase) inhibitor barstar